MRAYQKILAFLCALVLLLCAVPVFSSAESAEDTADLAVSSADRQWELTATVLWQSACESQRQCATFHPVVNESVEAVRVTVLPQWFRYTIDTGTTKFNTAIEYDTDINRTAYSRVKHYIVVGKAYSYEYDAAGNISKITDPNGSTVEYEYDSLNQLTREEHSLPCLKGGAEGEAEAEGYYYTAVDYSYDTRGNILSKTYTLTDGTTETITYGYTDPAWKDRLTVYNGVGINFDKIGNPATWHDGATMAWQHGRQLASYTDSDGVKTTYTYDADGIRTSKTTNSVTTEYYVIDGTLRRMTDGTNTLQFVYDNGLSSVIFNGTEYWYVFNAQGDVIGLIDATGTYVVEYTYDAWGKPLSKTGSLATTLGTLNPFRYRGYIYDEETGFYYCQTRYYDPEVRRFINSDNEALVTATPDVPYWDKNLYAYCDNNPIVRHDIGGEFWNTIISTVAGAIAGGVSAALSGTDIGAGILTGAMSGAITGVAIDATIVFSVAAPVALPVIAVAGGIGAAAASYTNQRLNGVSHEDVDYEAVVVDGLWGVAGGLTSGALADVGGAACQTVGQIISQPAKKVVQQATYDLISSTVVSAGTALCAMGTSSIRNRPNIREPLPSQTAMYSYSKDWFRYRYGGLW